MQPRDMGMSAASLSFHNDGIFPPPLNIQPGAPLGGLANLQSPGQLNPNLYWMSDGRQAVLQNEKLVPPFQDVDWSV